MNAIDVVGRQLERYVTVSLYQPFVAETKSQNFRDAVLMVQAEHDRADHVVQPRADTAACDDATHKRGRIEVQTLSRTGHFHRRVSRMEFCQRRRIQHSLVVADEAHA